MTEGLRAGTALRCSRAAVLATVAAAFAGVAHAAAGGSLPGPGLLLVLVGAATGLLACLLGRPASTLRVTTLLASGQAAMHAVFTASGGHPATAGDLPGSAPDVRPALPPGRLGDALLAPDVLENFSREPGRLAHTVTHLQADLSTPAAQRMAMAHLLAAAALGVWLAAGERLAWRLVALLAGSAARILVDSAARVRAVAGAHGGRSAPGATLSRVLAAGRSGWSAPLLLRTELLAHHVPRRGPPGTAAT